MNANHWGILAKKSWISVASNFYFGRFKYDVKFNVFFGWVSKIFWLIFLLANLQLFFSACAWCFSFDKYVRSSSVRSWPFFATKTSDIHRIFWQMHLRWSSILHLSCITHFLLWHIFKQTSYVHKCCNNFVQKMWFHILSTTVWIKVSLCITISY